MATTRECCRRFWKVVLDNLLLILLILSLGIGVGMGAGMRRYDFSERNQMYFKFPGDLLMRMLQALIIPLIVSSLVSGLASLDASSSGKMGLYTILYYLATTILAVLLGILLVTTIKPGEGSDRDVTGDVERANIADSFLDLIRNMLPDNLIEACFRQSKTYQVPVYGLANVTMNASDCDNYSTTLPQSCEVINETMQVLYYRAEVRKEDNMNVLGLVVFSIALGVVVSQLGETGKPLYLFCLALAEASMKLVTAVIWYSPIGIVFLVSSEIIQMTDPMQELQALALYIATVLAGIAIHGFIILPLIFLIVVRANPYAFLYRNLQALITALGTASSSATLPITYHCLEKKNGIDPRVTRFVLPVGAVINMDGTALYEAVAAVFIAQSRNFPLNAANIVAISVTSTLASIGAASVPNAGLVTMVIVLTAVGLPAEDVTMVLAVDWLVDRFRTMVNVEGDAYGAGIVAHLARDKLCVDDQHQDAMELSSHHSKQALEDGDPGIVNLAFQTSQTFKSGEPQDNVFAQSNGEILFSEAL